MDIQRLTRRTDGRTDKQEKGKPGGIVERGSLTPRSMDSTNMNKRGGGGEWGTKWVNERMSEWEREQASESVKSDAAHKIS